MTEVSIDNLKIKIDIEAGRVMLKAAVWRAEGAQFPRQRKSFERSADSMLEDVARAIAVREGSQDPYLLSMELRALKEIV